MDAVPPLALLPPPLGYSPIAEPSRMGGTERGCSPAPRELPLPLWGCRQAWLACGMRSGACPCFAGQPPLAGLIAVQGVLRSLPCRCRSLESLLIPGHPAWPCGQVVITCGASRAGSPGIAPRCQLSARATPRTPGTTFIPEMGNQRKTSHQRPGLTSQWGQDVGCGGVQLGDMLGRWGKERGESHWYPGLVPHPAPCGPPPCPSQPPGPSGGRWLAQHTPLPAESGLCRETLPAQVINPFSSGAVKCRPPVPVRASSGGPMAPSLRA